jgi:predicted membrane protein
VTARKILVIISAICFTLAWFSAFTIGLLDFAVWMCLSMLCLIANGAIRWVQKRQWIRGREETWTRREAEEILRHNNFWRVK